MIHTLLQNSFPWSEMRRFGAPNLWKHKHTPYGTASLHILPHGPYSAINILHKIYFVYVYAYST